MSDMRTEKRADEALHRGHERRWCRRLGRRRRAAARRRRGRRAAGGGSGGGAVGLGHHLPILPKSSGFSNARKIIQGCHRLPMPCATSSPGAPPQLKASGLSSSRLPSAMTTSAGRAPRGQGQLPCGAVVLRDGSEERLILIIHRSEAVVVQEPVAIRRGRICVIPQTRCARPCSPVLVRGMAVSRQTQVGQQVCLSASGWCKRASRRHRRAFGAAGTRASPEGLGRPGVGEPTAWVGKVLLYWPFSTNRCDRDPDGESAANSAGVRARRRRRPV